MTNDATSLTRFDTTTALALEAAFDGGRITSDGGLPWLAQIDSELGLCEELAAHVPEWRRGSVTHSLEQLVRQRVLQIACGYEDQDDADFLRSDPLLKLASAAGCLRQEGTLPVSRRFLGLRMPPTLVPAIRWPRRS
jgi:hypothetical protein